MTYSNERQRDVMDYLAPLAGAGIGANVGIYGSQAARARYLRGVGAARGEKAFANRYTTKIRANQVEDGSLAGKGRRVQVFSTAQPRDAKGRKIGAAVSQANVRAGELFGPVLPSKVSRVLSSVPNERGNLPLTDSYAAYKPMGQASAIESSRSYNTGVARRLKSGDKKGYAIEYDADNMRAKMRKARVKDINALSLARMDARRAKGYLGSVGEALRNKQNARGVGDYFGNLRKAVSKRSGFGALRLGAGGLGGAAIGGVLGSKAGDALRAAGYYG